MLFPERHLLAIVQPNPIRQSVRVLSDSPESAIFDLGDFEVDCLARVFGILYDEADDAGGKEVADCLGWEDDTRPVRKSVLTYRGEGTWHGCGCELWAAIVYAMNKCSGSRILSTTRDTQLY